MKVDLTSHTSRMPSEHWLLSTDPPMADVRQSAPVKMPSNVSSDSPYVSGANDLPKTSSDNKTTDTLDKRLSSIKLSDGVKPRQSNALNRPRTSQRVILLLVTLGVLLTIIIALWLSTPRQAQSPKKGRSSGQEIPASTPEVSSAPITLEPTPQKPTSNYDVSLENAIAKGDGDIDYWLEKGAHFTPQCLMWATYKATDSLIYTQNIKLAERIIDSGVSVNSRGSSPLGLGHEVDNPLSIAAFALNKRIMSFLLSKGADPNFTNHNFFNPGGESQFSVALSGAALRTSGGIQELRDIDNRKLSEIFDLLIAEGGNINFQDTNGKTLLMFAAELDREDYVRLLLKKGAKKELVDKEGHNAQYYAERRDTHLARMLAP